MCVSRWHFAEDIAFGKAAGVSTVLVDPEGRHQGHSSMGILADLILTASFGRILGAFGGKSFKQSSTEGSRSVDCPDSRWSRPVDLLMSALCTSCDSCQHELRVLAFSMSFLRCRLYSGKLAGNPSHSVVPLRC